MPGRQTQKIIVHIHHVHEKKVKSPFKLEIRSQKYGLTPFLSNVTILNKNLS